MVLAGLVFGRFVSGSVGRQTANKVDAQEKIHAVYALRLCVSALRYPEAFNRTLCFQPSSSTTVMYLVGQH